MFYRNIKIKHATFGTNTFHNFRFWILKFIQIILFQNISIISVIFRSVFGMLKAINQGSPGPKIPEAMEFGGLGPSHNKTKV